MFSTGNVVVIMTSPSVITLVAGGDAPGTGVVSGGGVVVVCCCDVVCSCVVVGVVLVFSCAVVVSCVVVVVGVLTVAWVVVDVDSVAEVVAEVVLSVGVAGESVGGSSMPRGESAEAAEASTRRRRHGQTSGGWSFMK